MRKAVNPQYIFLEAVARKRKKLMDVAVLLPLKA